MCEEAHLWLGTNLEKSLLLRRNSLSQSDYSASDDSKDNVSLSIGFGNGRFKHMNSSKRLMERE